MPEISVGAQIFDLVFHPTHSIVYTGLLTGHVKAFSYDDQGNYNRAFSVRPSKRSCRGLAISEDGAHLYAVGKSEALNIIDTVTENIETRPGAHDAPINRIKCLMPSLFATGDDEGVIKLWDPRQQKCARTYTHHFDYITDFLFLEDSKHLVSTSGDGTLSVMDIRSKKTEPFALSENQEDELLSMTSIKGDTKVVVGTQTGVLSIFNRNSGWGDCVDRVPGHPHSVDALCSLPSSIPNVDTSSTILTGSSDGLVRAVKVLPTKLLGIVADHGDLPIERIGIGGGGSQLTLEQASSSSKDSGKVGKNREGGGGGEGDEYGDDRQIEVRGRWWVGSVGHDEVLRLTDLGAFFHEGEVGSTEGVETALSAVDHIDDELNSEAEAVKETSGPGRVHVPAENMDSGEESEAPRTKKRKSKPEKNPLTTKKKGKNSVEADRMFFNGL
ncbi:WD40 repeat-like protein [Tricholoma matsutake]|nr:WD40 repeat-like protein [Tricholoma matsutake 945]